MPKWNITGKNSGSNRAIYTCMHTYIYNIHCTDTQHIHTYIHTCTVRKDSMKALEGSSTPATQSAPWTRKKWKRPRNSTLSFKFRSSNPLQRPSRSSGYFLIAYYTYLLMHSIIHSFDSTYIHTYFPTLMLNTIFSRIIFT